MNRALKVENIVQVVEPERASGMNKRGVTTSFLEYRVKHRLKGHRSAVNALSFSHDTEFLATGGENPFNDCYFYFNVVHNR
jgi:hypothetical protein